MVDETKTAHRIHATPSAVAELFNIVYQLGRDGSEAANPWRATLDEKRPDLVARVRALWPDSHHLIPRGMELFWVAAMNDHIAGTDPEPFFEKHAALVRASLRDRSKLKAAGDSSPELAQARIERLESLLDAQLQADYIDLLRALWAEMGTSRWERNGLPVVQVECTRIEQAVARGSDIMELFPPKHFLRFEEYAARLDEAMRDEETVVITPLHYSRGGYLIDLDIDGLPLFVGYSARHKGVHKATVEKAKQLAARMRAFSDPTRLTILLTIGHLDVTVGDLAKLLEISQPSVSGHLRVLLAADLVTRRKKGARSFYRADPAAIKQLLETTMAEFG